MVDIAGKLKKAGEITGSFIAHLKAPYGISWLGWMNVCKDSFYRFLADDCMTYAAAITFYFTLSFFPLILLLLSLGGFVLNHFTYGVTGEEELYTQLLVYLKNVIPFITRDMLATISLVVESRNALGIIGLCSLFLSSTLAFGALEQALKRMLGKTPMHFIVQRLFVAALIFGMGFLLAVSIFLSTMIAELAGRYVPILLDLKNMVAGFPVVGYFTPLVLLVCGYIIIMKYFLGSNIGWRSTVGGGVVFAILFTIARTLYHIYLHRLSNLNALYGSLTAVIMMIMWMYYLSIILLFSVEFVRTIRDRKEIGPNV